MARRRRFGFDRRVGDRRDFSGSYARDEVLKIREALRESPTARSCPSCGGSLRVGQRVADDEGTTREVQCTKCQRRLTMADYTMARILVIDDEDMVRRALNLMLSKAGHEVVDAGDGETGLQSYKDTAADILLVDMRMPGMDGIEFMRRCRAQFPGARIIAMSGGRRYGAPDPLAMARNIGAIRTLRKPFTQQEMLEIVDEVLL